MEFEDLDEVNELLHYGLIDDDYQPTERGAIAKVKGEQDIDSVRRNNRLSPHLMKCPPVMNLGIVVSLPVRNLALILPAKDEDEVRF